jgi:hypothetical protein
VVAQHLARCDWRSPARSGQRVRGSAKRMDLRLRQERHSPKSGDFVELRGRRWLVEAAEPIGSDLAVINLSCISDDAQGESLDVLWDAEIGPRKVLGALVKADAERNGGRSSRSWALRRRLRRACAGRRSFSIRRARHGL